MPKPALFLNRLAGRSAIVTGAGSPAERPGIGAAIARIFAGEGASVCVVDRDGALAAETVALITAESGTAYACQGDITSEEDVERMAAETVANGGGIDILVNNVGIAGTIAPLDALTQSDWDTVLEVNLKGAVMLTRAAMPYLIAAGNGSIVNIASVSGLIAHGVLAYGPSKAALISLTRELAVVYGRQGVRSNAIAPGHLFTPMVEEAFNDAQREIRRKIAPLGIKGDAWDVAAGALFLASDEARFITATCLPIDGGVSSLAPLAALGLVA